MIRDTRQPTSTICLITIVILLYAPLLNAQSSTGYVYPQDHTPSFNAVLNTDGSINVEFNGHSYSVRSVFSYPPAGTRPAGWNSFGAIGKEETGWSVSKEDNDEIIVGKGAYYEIKRKIIKTSRSILVKDTMINLSDSTIGIAHIHYLKMTRKPRKVYVCGKEVGGSASQYQYAFNLFGNPTIFISLGDDGVGLVAEDKVSRVDAKGSVNPWDEPLLSDQFAQLVNTYFGLKPTQTYTLEWSIYPVSSPDYYDFINIVRKAEDVNFKIENFMFLPPNTNDKFTHWTTKSDQEFKNYLINLNVKYICLYGLKKADLTKTVLGTAYLDEVQNAVLNGSWKIVNMAIDKIRKTGLDIKIVISLGPFIDSHSMAAQKYPDSLMYNVKGEVAKYNSYSYLMIPTVTNSFGQKLIADNGLIDFLMNKNGINTYLEGRKIDGIYIDTSRWASGFWAGKNPNSTDTTEDFSYSIDWQYKIAGDLVNVTLTSLDFRLEYIKKVFDDGGFIVANFPPVTKEFAGIARRPNFGESSTLGTIKWTHLYSPVGLASPSDESINSALRVLSGEDDIRNLRQHLEEGVLHYPYGYRPDWDGNPYQKLYPITPMELHAGTIIGEERIVTTHKGYYGWGDNSDYKVFLYDPAGRLVANDFASTIYQNMRFVDLSTLPDNYLAIIARTCSDGTLYGECSATSQCCENGRLVNPCSQ